ncbi:hypothetical protein ACJJTC_019482 [Scirpophaga incertulas]
MRHVDALSRNPVGAVMRCVKQDLIENLQQDDDSLRTIISQLNDELSKDNLKDLAMNYIIGKRGDIRILPGELQCWADRSKLFGTNSASGRPTERESIIIEPLSGEHGYVRRIAHTHRSSPAPVGARVVRSTSQSVSESDWKKTCVALLQREDTRASYRAHCDRARHEHAEQPDQCDLDHDHPLRGVVAAL